MLEAAGYTVLEAGRPSEALGVVASHPGTIDLLLTDVVMPEINGPALAEQIRALRPETKVVFTSGYPGGTLRQQGTLSADVSYLEKPFTPRALAGRVRETLDRDVDVAGQVR